MPSPVVIEVARADDAAAVARVHEAGLVAGYVGRVPARVLDPPDTRTSGPVWRRWLARSRARTFVARKAGTVVGFCTLQPAPGRGRVADSAEIPIVVVHPAHWRLGIGRALCDRAIAEAAALGVSELVLWVLESNDPARAFYSSLGFCPDGQQRVFTETTVDVLHEMRYRRLLDPIGPASTTIR